MANNIVLEYSVGDKVTVVTGFSYYGHHGRVVRIQEGGYRGTLPRVRTYRVELASGHMSDFAAGDLEPR